MGFVIQATHGPLQQFGAVMEGEHPLTVVEVAVGPSHARSRECVQEELRAAYAADQQAREEGEDVDETQPPSPGSSHVFKITL